ncbi:MULTISPECIES: LacI family DNA-binding transcriptional regulator [Rhodobacterales]|uniref:LacI family DNA-binding transcriptional regulator n=1 Tax=Roseobacter sp. N2S TaxID=2663844 RepID=UPI00285CA5A9|nr:MULTISPECIES: LacI family DNA-binding transcriptional regulator [Rhodobacterales]MDR6265890.1 LacI family transcriptional regulator [Roseobacter sp. N2S]
MTDQSKANASMANVAEQANVSLATVDRVLNRRKGVKPRTAQKVLATALELGFFSQEEFDSHHRDRPLNIAVLLPAGTNPYLRMLGEKVRARAAKPSRDSAKLRCFFIESFDANALAAALRHHAHWADGIAFMAIDHPTVRAALEEVTAAGTRVVTIITDLPHPARSAYVGLENQMAGRTAGLLMGRFCREPAGSVALVAGSRNYRAHSEREAGFMALLDEMFPTLQLVGLREGHDSAAENYRHTLALIDQTPDLVGVYNVGGASDGIARALVERDRRDLVFIGHGLTPDTRRLLIDGTMDTVIDSDPESILDTAIRLIENPDHNITPYAVKMDVFLRENLPPMQL